MMQRNADKRKLQQETNSQDSMSDTSQIPLGTSEQGIYFVFLKNYQIQDVHHSGTK